MAIKDALIHFGAGIYLERPVRNKSQADLVTELEATCQEILRHLSNVTQNSANTAQLRHIIGIERWGQRRLQIVLGAPSINDEYDGYRPPDIKTWSELVQGFEFTRNDTIAIVAKMDKGQFVGNFIIPHNSFGSLSLRAWVRYLIMHARNETLKMK